MRGWFERWDGMGGGRGVCDGVLGVGADDKDRP